MEEIPKSNSESGSESTEQAKSQTGPKHIYPRWECPICGARIWASNKKRHLSTKKHNDAQYVLTDRFEIM